MYHYFIFFLLPNSIFYNYQKNASVPKRKNSGQGDWTLVYRIHAGKEFWRLLPPGWRNALPWPWFHFHNRPLCPFLSMVIGFSLWEVFSASWSYSQQEWRHPPGGLNSFFSLFLTHVWGLKDYFKVQTVNSCFSSGLWFIWQYGFT